MPALWEIGAREQDSLLARAVRQRAAGEAVDSVELIEKDSAESLRLQKKYTEHLVSIGGHPQVDKVKRVSAILEDAGVACTSEEVEQLLSLEKDAKARVVMGLPLSEGAKYRLLNLFGGKSWATSILDN